MARRDIYGIHSFTAINRSTGLPYGTVKVLGSANLNHTGELNELRGGSNPNPVATELGNVTNEISLNLKEYASWLHTLAGAEVTNNAAEANGGASALTNKVGTSVFEATTGIASAGVKSGSEADVKGGIYIVKAVSATTVDVYIATDIDFTRGTDLSYVDTSLKVTSSPLTITTGAAVEIPNTGIELTGGSGTIAMTDEDVARFEVRSANTGSSLVEYKENPVPVEFEGIFYSQKKSDNGFTRIDGYKCKFADFPIGMTEKEFSTSDIVIKLDYDEDIGKVYDLQDKEGS